MTLRLPRSRPYYPLMLLMLVIPLIFGPVLIHMITQRGADYQPHLNFALEMQQGTREIIPHPLFHFGTLVFYVGFPALGILRAGLLFSILTYMLLGMVIYRFYIYPVMGIHSRWTMTLLKVVLTVSLMLVSAVTVLTWTQHNLYRGYHLPNTYHSPTMAVLRPLALLLFLYVVGVFSSKPYFQTRVALLSAMVLTVLTSTAKPNYTISMLPVVCLAVAWVLFQRRTINWRLLVFGLVLPAAIVIGVQMLMLPSSSIGGGDLLFMPFGASNFWRPGDHWLLKLMLSVLFPLVVYGVYFRSARQDTAFNLALLIFLVGAVYSYMLVEADRITDANFIWSGQITVFVLLVVTMTFFLRQIYDRETRRFRLNRAAVLCLAVFMLHLISGLLWYATELTTSSEARWW